VRPEHIAIGTAAAGRNAIVAKLQRRSFLGESVDLVLTDRTGQEIVARAGEGAPGPAGELVAHFSPNDTLCFAAPES
jgi:TOBE domain-containing protein